MYSKFLIWLETEKVLNSSPAHMCSLTQVRYTGVIVLLLHFRSVLIEILTLSSPFGELHEMNGSPSGRYQDKH